MSDVRGHTWAGKWGCRGRPVHQCDPGPATDMRGPFQPDGIMVRFQARDIGVMDVYILGFGTYRVKSR